MDNYSIKSPVNMAPSGIATFAKTPLCTDINNFDGDIAIIGVPCDISIQGRSGARLGPRGIRLQSTRFKYTPLGSYDPEKDEYYLSTNRWEIYDCGDIDYVPGDIKTTFLNIENAVRILKRKNALPVILGGDHSISIPVARGLDEVGNFNVIHIDAHLDWTDEIGGQTLFNGSPCRIMSKMKYVNSMTHLGIHGIGSSKQGDFYDARNNGDLILSPKQIRKIGIEKVIDMIPDGDKYYVTIDVDAFDYSIASGTGSPMLGGLYYDEAVELLEGISKLGKIIALDFVEVSPNYDDAGGTTCYLAARVISDFLGFITKEIEKNEKLD